MKYKIILASASPRRVTLMKNLGLQFEILPADIDEIVEPGLSPEKVVMNLARDKAEKVKGLVENREETGTSQIIVAADTVVALGQKILGKPLDRNDAIEMLTQLSASEHFVYTGVNIFKSDGQGQWRSLTDYGETRVFMRDLARSEIEAYVDSGEPMDKAGAYALQGIGAFLVKGIEGCPANVIGLPVPKVLEMLRSLGLAVMQNNEMAKTKREEL
jgi:MAF protein